MSPWPNHVDFIQDMWNKGIMEEQWGFRPAPENTHIFICGNPRMINDMTEALEKDNFTEWSRKNPEGHIHVEKF